MSIKKEKKNRKFNEKKLKPTNKIINIIIWLIFGVVITLASELLQRGNLDSLTYYLENNFKMFITNYLIVLTATASAFIFKKGRALYLIISSIILMASLLSGVMIKFRGTPFIWADIYSIKEGLIIAKKYLNKEIIVPILVGIIIIILLLVTLWKTEKHNNLGKKTINKYINIYGVILTVVSFIFANSYILYLDKTNKKVSFPWDIPSSYSHNGFMYSFLETASGFKVDKPKDYNKKSIEKIGEELNEYNILAFNENGIANDYDNEKPNVIIIQLESFMDPKILSEIKITNDVLKNYRKLYNSYPHGIVNVPTYGGGTVRSEFEVLTGFTTDFLPIGEIPNNNILKKQPVESLAYILDEHGYESSVVHNYIGNFYDRDIVYPNLGFNNYISMEYMDKPSEKSEGQDMYPEDMINLQPMEELLKQEKPQFIYNITVESHGGYADNLTNEDFIVKDKSLTPLAISQLQSYFNKLKGVDEYIGELIDYLNNLKEPTVVLMFSDHLPSLEVINRDNSSINSTEKYEAQYVIWNNIGLPNITKNLEAYQLSTYLLDLIKINGGIMPNFHKIYGNKSNYKEELQDIQYDLLFGDKYIFNNSNPYKKSNLHMGINDIKVEKRYIDKGVLIVKGENFTYKSSILIDGKIIPTKFIDENTLVSYECKEEVKNLSVGQIGKYNKVLSKSNSIK
ncbi:LTA synthase family protein [Clostridium tarantellae]|uniref:Sulfatase-like hydrolase/transferase n=1 Tax=Clostridium tarantellae TaxID=39493 RepID=A0A6I1MQK3_9CLOT|nr:LTA synthase family protein [Clostridium tarantellae]MPQ42579.1 sulfatase-like hydrolase/transferase [Clostridium tarantellae]